VRVRPRVVQAILAKYGAHSAVDTRQLRFFRGKKSVASINRKGKRLNLRALMVQRELSTRESGRGFLSVSSRYPRMLAAAQEARSKFGPAISSARLESKGSESSATILWDGTRGELPASAAEGLLKPRGRAAIGLALRDVTSDTLDYVQRKLGESAKAARLK
jgi:hypothetical protein